MKSKQIFTGAVPVFLAAVFATPAVAQRSSAAPRMMPGIAVAHQSADLALTVNQRLLTVHVTEGQAVEAGQLLAELDHGIARAEYEAARAIADDRSAIDVANIDLREAESRLQRIEEALSGGASNQLELQTSRNNYEKAVAQLALLKSRQLRADMNAETARQKMESYLIRAPFDGVITRQHISIGNMVAPGEAIFSIVNASRLRIELNLPLELLGRLQSGETYQLAAGAPLDCMLDAKLQFVSPVVDAASQTFRCVFEFDNRQSRLPAGFEVTLSNEQLTGLPDSGSIAGR